MLCTANPGGMRSVVEGYRRDGLFESEDVQLLITHGPGTVAQRIAIACRALVKFVALMFSRDVHMVHAHAAMRGSFWRKNIFLLIARFFGKKTVLHLHGSEFRQFVAAQGSFGQMLIRHALRRADQVLVLSASWQQLVKELAPSANVVILPNYVPIPPRPRGAASSGRVRCLFLGVLGQRKGIYDLLSAMAEVKAAYPTIELIAGGNGEVDAVRERVVEAGLTGEVSVPGWIGPERKVELLSEADIYILPSHNEGLPVSVLEAMAFGLPVISTFVGGIPELVRDGIDGLLVEAGDAQALAAAILRLAQSPELRASMGQAGRARVSEYYSPEYVLPMLRQVYRRLA